MTQTNPSKRGAPQGNQNARKHGRRDADARHRDHLDHQLYCECRQLLRKIQEDLRAVPCNSKRPTSAGKQNVGLGQR